MATKESKTRFITLEEAREFALVEVDWCRENEIQIYWKETEIFYGKHKNAEIKCVKKEPNPDGMEIFFTDKTENKIRSRKFVCRIFLSKIFK
jgi:hypothetical protein